LWREEDQKMIEGKALERGGGGERDREGLTENGERLPN
jgi:hypothetical protein